MKAAVQGPPSGDDRLTASARWARSGLALLTGGAEPAPPGRDYAGLLEALLAAARRAGAPDLDMRLFAERAAELGLTRHGGVSANGAARLLRTVDGWVAVNLARPDDLDAVPAWIGCEIGDDPWTALTRAALLRKASDLAQAGQELGVPVAAVGVRDDEQQRARGRIEGARIVRLGQGRPGPIRRPLVIDLSALWAGPLCAHILGLAGARVVKVESVRRPDAARQGPAAFFDRLHAGHESVALDFTQPRGRAQLARLIARADVVIEASRPRALEQLGIDLEAAFQANPALVWVSITAFGRTGPWRNRVGFGDDAAAAGGLLVWDAGQPMFVGDALADPIAGVTAATAALGALANGGGILADVALREAAAFVAGADPISEAERDAAAGEPLTPPAMRPVTGRAAPMGAHTAAVLAELA